jgi:hypothetical protein
MPTPEWSTLGLAYTLTLTLTLTLMVAVFLSAARA